MEVDMAVDEDRGEGGSSVLGGGGLHDVVLSPGMGLAGRGVTLGMHTIYSL